MADNQENKVVEKHNIATLEHEMRVDGHYLSEKKQKTVIAPKESESPKKTIHVHFRCIDQRFLKITKILDEEKSEPEILKETEMKSDEEIQTFEADWEKYWQPKISQEDHEF